MHHLSRAPHGPVEHRRAGSHLGQDGASLCGRGPQGGRGRGDGEAQPCLLDQPVLVEHPATFGLMVLPRENLMALPGLGQQPVGLQRVDFELRSSATRIRTGNPPVNSPAKSQPFIALQSQGTERLGQFTPRTGRSKPVGLAQAGATGNLSVFARAVELPAARAAHRPGTRQSCRSDLHLLPSGAGDGESDRADLAGRMRPDDGADRVSVGRLGSDRRAAHRARAAQDRSGRHSASDSREDELDQRLT